MGVTPSSRNLGLACFTVTIPTCLILQLFYSLKFGHTIGLDTRKTWVIRQYCCDMSVNKVVILEALSNKSELKAS